MVASILFMTGSESSTDPRKEVNHEPVAILQEILDIWSCDRMLSRIAKSPRGWYMKNFYQMRWHNRRGRFGIEIQGTFQVYNHPVLVWIMAEQLGSLYSIFAECEYDLRNLISTAPSTILDLGAKAWQLFT